MANAVIGALRVVLGADSAALSKGLDNAGRDLDAFAKHASKAAAAIGVAIGAAAVAIGVGIKNAIDRADSLGKMAQKVGIPVEELSKLSLAARLADVSLETLSNSMGKLSKNMVEAANKPLSDAANAFKVLGISVKNSDGSLKSSSTIMEEVAGKFEKLNDGAGKTAVSLALFGKSGKELIPLLNSGRDGFREAAEEAEAFGIVVSGRTARAAELFNDNITRLNAAKQGLFQQIAIQLLPTLGRLTSMFVQMVKDGDSVKSMADTIAEAFVWVSKQVAAVSLAFTRLGVEWQSFSKLFTTVPFTEAWRKAFSEFVEAGDETKRQMTSLAARFDMSDPIGNTADALNALGPAIKKTTRDLDTSALAGKNSFDSFLVSVQKRIAGLKAEEAAIGQSIGVKERLAVVEQGLIAKQEAGGSITEAQRVKWIALGFEVEKYKLKIEGMKLEEEVRPAWMKFNEELQKNIDLFNAGGLSAEGFARANKKVAEDAGATWQQAGASIAGSIATIGKAFGKENKAMATVAKAAGIVQATISMFTGAAKALELPFPANLAAMAAVLAQGATLVASIKGTAVGFATGGSFKVPGGMGGGDKVFTPLMLEPGEQVDIWRPGEAGDPRGRAGGSGVTINVLTDDVSRPVIEKLIKGLDEAFGDGHTMPNFRMAT